MGFIDKIKGAIGTDDLDYNEYENDELFGDDETETDNDYDHNRVDNRKAQAGTNMNSGMMSNNASIELKVVKPVEYDSVTLIADHLLNHRTVVLNLEDTNKETARRLIDFLSGVAYSINGSLKRVANNTFVITPDNVDVSGDKMRTEPKGNKEDVLYSDL